MSQVASVVVVAVVAAVVITAAAVSALLHSCEAFEYYRSHGKAASVYLPPLRSSAAQDELAAFKRKFGNVVVLCNTISDDRRASSASASRVRL